MKRGNNFQRIALFASGLVFVAAATIGFGTIGLSCLQIPFRKDTVKIMLGSSESIVTVLRERTDWNGPVIIHALGNESDSSAQGYCARTFVARGFTVIELQCGDSGAESFARLEATIRQVCQIQSARDFPTSCIVNDRLLIDYLLEHQAKAGRLTPDLIEQWSLLEYGPGRVLGLFLNAANRVRTTGAQSAIATEIKRFKIDEAFKFYPALLASVICQENIGIPSRALEHYALSAAVAREAAGYERRAFGCGLLAFGLCSLLIVGRIDLSLMLSGVLIFGILCLGALLIVVKQPRSYSVDPSNWREGTVSSRDFIRKDMDVEAKADMMVARLRSRFLVVEEVTEPNFPAMICNGKRWLEIMHSHLTAEGMRCRVDEAGQLQVNSSGRWFTIPTLRLERR